MRCRLNINNMNIEQLDRIKVVHFFRIIYTFSKYFAKQTLNRIARRMHRPKVCGGLQSPLKNDEHYFELI